MDWRYCFYAALVVALLLESAFSISVKPWSLRNKREVRTRGTLCDGKYDNVLYPLESDCTKYLLCIGNYEYIASCPIPLFYDEELQACNFDEGDACAAKMQRLNNVPVPQAPTHPDIFRTTAPVRVITQPFCENRPDGTYADPGRCDQYIVCSNALPHIRACPLGLLFRTDTNRCDFDSDGTCNGASPARASDELALPTHGTPAANVAQRAEAVMPGAVEKAMNALMVKMREETDMANNLKGQGRGPFRLVQNLQKGKPIVKQFSMNAFILENVTLEVRDQLGLSADSATMAVLRGVTSPLSPNPNTIRSDEPAPKTDPSMCPYPRYSCTGTRYRSWDGTCNNLQHTIRGRALTPLRRNLPATYGDGLKALRKAKSGSELPNPRSVSSSVLQDRDLPEPMHTIMVMQWGQFLDHDLTLTALTKLPKDPNGAEKTVDLECGSDGCDTSPAACQPIAIPAGDPDFPQSKKCLMFVRSEGVPNLDCKIGPREQLNQLTSYIDASQIYGSSKEEAESLRDSDTSRGKLKMSANPNSSLKQLLPTSTTDKLCLERQPTCYMAGDERVNEQGLLTSMHVVWLREHNRIEAGLHKENPTWSGERLYQETRRIVGALQQQITYGEFLPVVLGPIVMNKYGLLLQEEGFFNGYNSSEDASVSNVFASAAFRFGHSLLMSSVKLLDKDYKGLGTLQLSEMFFRPDRILSKANDGIDGFLRAVCTGRHQTFDRFLTKEVTARLFSDSPPHGLGTDLASLNIKRARDHGIPGYNAWRVWCGLRKANDFNDLVEMKPSIRQSFKNLYESVDDIDLFPAGLAETPVEGSLLGHTFSCILGREFARLRTGDRFWYEKSDQFSQAQLQEIRKMKLSKIICTNGDNITQIQPSVFESPFRDAYPKQSSLTTPQDGLPVEWLQQLWTDNYNRREQCHCLPALDFSKFAI